MKRNFFRSNYLSIITVIVAATALLACKKTWLEAKVTLKQAVPSTVKDFQAMLDNFTLINRLATANLESAADGHYYTDVVWNTFKGTVRQNAYTWTNSVPYLSTSNGWSAEYKAIAASNVVLDELVKVKGEDPSELNNIKGQALFTRSILFYHLVQIFSPAYDNKADVSMGIPLRLSSDITIPSARLTLKATYDQIISDLILAKDLLPQNALFQSRGSKIAAIGLLARIYLIIGDYSNALKYSNEYLQIKKVLLDYNTILPTASFIGNNIEIEYINLLPSFVTEISNYLVDQSLYNLYNENDLRKTRFFRIAPTGIQFKGTYGSNLSDIFCGIATDEMYLIRAESYARTGNITLAMKDLNDLIRTRWAKNTDGTTKYVDRNASDETEALRIILEERRKELILRNLRWSDLKRLNLDNRFKITLTRTIGGTTYTLEPGSYKYTFPIPQDIIAMTGMQQNPGWQ